MKSYNICRIGDIAYEGNKSKTFAFGRFVENDFKNGIISHVFPSFRPKSSLNLAFMKHYIHCEMVMRPILARSTSMALTMSSLDTHSLVNCTILMPNLNEQQRIGSMITTLDNLIAAQERKLQLLRRKKQAYLQKMFA